MEINENFYTTPDLNLATVISLSYPLDSIERLSDRKMAFVFKREEGLDQLIESFWKRGLMVEPNQYSEHRKMLIARMGNEEGFGGF